MKRIGIVSLRSPWCRLTDGAAEQLVEEWRATFGITQQISLERVDRSQVTDHRGHRGCSLVGVVFDADDACVYHTRALTEEDIIHELLHVAHPEWEEATVVVETSRLTAQCPVRSRRSPTGNARRASCCGHTV